MQDYIDYVEKALAVETPEEMQRYSVEMIRDIKKGIIEGKKTAIQMGRDLVRMMACNPVCVLGMLGGLEAAVEKMFQMQQEVSQINEILSELTERRKIMEPGDLKSNLEKLLSMKGVTKESIALDLKESVDWINEKLAFEEFPVAEPAPEVAAV